jgi:hypothetical protein
MSKLKFMRSEPGYEIVNKDDVAEEVIGWRLQALTASGRKVDIFCGDVIRIMFGNRRVASAVSRLSLPVDEDDFIDKYPNTLEERRNGFSGEADA